MHMFYRVVLVALLAILFSSCDNKENSSSLAAEDQRQSNDLIKETSPYLLQHAYNPVDWKAWNPESLEVAQEENKLIVISIGYSACHWCHVMEEESFENDSIAVLMNDNFVSIKVDREERPDIDKIYMDAVQLMTGSGGWPLNCITLPDGRPVFGGTYFSKSQWERVLIDMSNLYKTDPNKVIEYANQLTKGLKSTELITVNKDIVAYNKESLASLIDLWRPTLDSINGGELNAPKFAMPSQLDFLLRYAYQNDDQALLKHVKNSLVKMANGGIYDQIGGGFSRYTVDEEWHVPHFEKMLYDNAQLVSLYSNAYQLTGDVYYKKIVEETLTFVSVELTQKEGAFYSSLDADSLNELGEKKEGAFYTWTQEELQLALQSEFELFKSYYNIIPSRKWEDDTYILFKTQTDAVFLKENNLSQEQFETMVASWKTKLYDLRKNKKRPLTDDKVLTSWNSLMLKSYVEAYTALGDKKHLDIAIKNAKFIKSKQLNKDGSLFHNYKEGKSTINGFAEDYAHTIDAFIVLYQATLNEDWLNTANDLMQYSIIHFYDENTGVFYFTSDNQLNLISRKIEVVDNVIPSSNSVLAQSLFKLSHYYSNPKYAKVAQQMLATIESDIKNTPSGYSNWLHLYMDYSNPYYEIAVSGKDAIKKVSQLHKQYIPNILIAGATSDSQLPIMKSRFSEGETYIYVCLDGSCKLPVTEIDDAIDQLVK